MMRSRRSVVSSTMQTGWSMLFSDLAVVDKLCLEFFCVGRSSGSRGSKMIQISKKNCKNQTTSALDGVLSSF